MELKYGWCGKILWIDLRAQKSWTEDISDLCPEYLGCRGIAARLCWDHLKPGTGAFDEGNLLMFFCGPCAGTPVLAGGRAYFFGVGAQSYPEMYTRSSIGGRCGAALKYCGFDGVILMNKSEKRVVVEINEEKAVFHDASKYWGHFCVDTQKMIKEDFGEEAESCVIGPAGEHKVRIAGIFCDRDNAAAQAGFGAVMGDKNVKALVFTGHKGVRVADVKTIMELRDSCMRLKTVPKKKDTLPRYLGIGADGVGDVKYTNGRIVTQDVLDKGEAQYITQKGNSCVACGVPCHLSGYTFVRGSNGRYHRTADTSNSSKCTAKLMYGWVAACPMELEWLESRLGRNYRWPMDFRTGAECCWMINNLGLNSWDLCSLFLWLTELEWEGVDMDKLTGLHWDVDDPTLMPHLIEMLSYREGFGDLLAEGMARCGEKLGGIYKKHSDHCMHGMCNHSLGTGSWWALKYPYWVAPALEWAVGTRDPMSDEGHKYPDFCGRRIPFKRLPELAKAYYGVDHTIDPDPALIDTMDRKTYDDLAYTNREYVARKQEMRGVIMGCGVFCDTVYPQTLAPGDENTGYHGDWDMEAKLMTAVTGIHYTNADLEAKAERIWNMERCYSIREINRTKEYDMKIVHCHDSHNGDWTTGTKIDPVRFSALLDRYYRLMGWDENGIPTEEKLLSLGLPECNEAMKSHREAAKKGQKVAENV
jgi:aldehyde:ferredoxin oxidoreductase